MGEAGPARFTFPARTGIFWLRFRYRVADPEMLPPGFVTMALSAYEVFWDGELVARSGVPGVNRAQELAGPVDNFGLLPERLRRPGEHVVALRMSNHRFPFYDNDTGIRITLNDPIVFRENRVRAALFPALAAGAGFIIALAALLFWLLVERQPTLGLLSLICGAGALMQSSVVLRLFYGIRYDWYAFDIYGRGALVAVVGILLIKFMVAQFALPIRRWWWFAALLPGVVVACILNPTLQSYQGLYFLAWCSVFALGLALWAAAHRQRVAWLSVVGLGIGTGLWVWAPLRFALEEFATAFLPVLLGFIATFAIDLLAARRKARDARLTAARLEIELLKKNLQPHFLLNTLTAVSELVEQNPAAAVKFIDDLAAEFRSLALMSGERLVPLKRELDLCRTHLKIISQRTGRKILLAVEVADEAALVPPALFLTLIENGLLYQQAEAGSAFRLMARPLPNGMRYVFVSPRDSGAGNGENASSIFLG
jgi:plasmid stabilization system protein ParE